MIETLTILWLWFVGCILMWVLADAVVGIKKGEYWVVIPAIMMWPIAIPILMIRYAYDILVVKYIVYRYNKGVKK